MKRMRGRTHRNGGGGGGGGGSPRQYGGNVPLNRNHVFDSSGPDLRIRGTAQQLFEKYLQLGRDATGSGDRVMAESYFQYAEHYFRIVNAINQAAQQNAPNGANAQPHGGQNGHYQGQGGQPQYAGNGQGQNGQPQGGQAQGGQAQGGQAQGGQAQGGQYNGHQRREREAGEDDEAPMANGPIAYPDQPATDPRETSGEDVAR